jgi:tetratricopeptide (TPR) repeat protein
MGRRAEAIVQEAVSMLSQSEKWKQTPPPWAGDTQLLRVMQAQLCKTTLELCEEAVELDPAYAHAHCIMGHVLDIMVHDPREAARHFQLAAELSVTPDPVNHYNAARCWSNPNHTLDPPRLQESMKQFRASVAADSSFGPGHYNYALLLRQEDDDAAAAEKHYRAAIAADPADPRAHHNLACIVWKDNSDLPGAVELLQTAMKLVQNPVPLAKRPFSDCISGPMDAALCTQALSTVYREIHHAKLAREAAAMDEDEFRETYRTIVTEFGEVPNDITGDRRVLASQAFLEDHPELLTETAANILVVDAMAVMFEKPGHAAVSLSVECMCHQSVLVQYILAVAKDKGAEPIDACKRFCKSLQRGLVENAGAAAREKARKTKNRKKKGKHKGKQGQQRGGARAVGDWGSAAPEFEDDGGFISRGRASEAFDDDIRVLCAKVRHPPLGLCTPMCALLLCAAPPLCAHARTGRHPLTHTPPPPPPPPPPPVCNDAGARGCIPQARGDVQREQTRLRARRKRPPHDARRAHREHARWRGPHRGDRRDAANDAPLFRRARYGQPDRRARGAER